MKDELNTKTQLIAELARLRRQNAELKTAENQLRQGDKALRESKEDYRKLIDTSGYLAFRVNLEGNLAFINRELAKLLGYSTEELTAINIFDLIHPEDVEHVKDRFGNVASGRNIRNVEYRCKTKMGPYIYMLANTIPSIDSQGNVVGIMGTARNITKRKQAEEAMLDSQERLSSFMNSATEAFTLFDSNLNLTYINRIALKKMGLQKEDLIGKNLLDITPDLRESGRYDRYLEVIKTGEPFNLDECFGHTTFGDIYFSIRAFKVGSHLGVIYSDITKRKQMERALEEREEKLRRIFESTIDGITITDTSGRITDANESAAHIHGFDSREELIGKGISNLLPHHEKERAKSGLSSMLAKSSHQTTEYELLKADGSSFPAELSISLLKDDDGATKGIVTVTRDITERKQMERVLTESEEKYRNVVERANDGIVIVKDGVLKYCNPSGANMLGYTVDEAIGAHITDGFPQKELPKLIDFYNQRVAGKNPPSNYETILLQRDGTELHVEIGAGLINYEGSLADLIVFHDLTERKKSEKNLRESEERFRALTENTMDAITILAADGTLLYETPSAATMLGFETGEGLGKNSLEAVHPDDMQTVTHSMAELLENKGKTVQLEPRVQHKNGSWHTFEVSAKNLLDNPAVAGIVVNQHDITERKRAEEALQESEEQFRTLVSNIPGVIYRAASDKHRTMYLITGTIHDICGYPAVDFINNKVRSYSSIVHPDDREMMDQTIREAVSQKLSFTIEYRVIHADGSVKWVHENGQGIFASDGLLKFVDGAVFDITEPKQAKTNLQESEERYRAIFEHAAESILLINPGTGELLQFNDQAYINLGYTREEFEGIRISDIDAIESTEQISKQLKRIITKGTAIFETKHRTKNGQIRNVSVSCKSVEIQGKNLIQCMWHDITEQRQMEKEATKTRELEKIDKLRSALLASVSHELRTPLTAIKGLSSTLIQPDVEWDVATQKDFLETINREADRLTHIVNDLVDMSQLEVGIMRIIPKEASIHSLIEQLRDELFSQAGNHRLEINLPDSLPLIYADEIRIGEVISNLVSNAAAYSDEGSQIETEARQEGENLLISVTDHGIGIPAEHLEKVFDRFYRLEEGAQRRKGGTGLGLSICKGIVEAHNGKIWGESEVGKGSKFSFSLPTRKTTADIKS